MESGTTLQESVEAKIAKIIPLTKEESERNHEREFGFRRSILLFVTVTFVALSAWAFFRMRRNRVQYGKVKKSKSRRNGKGIRLDDSNAILVDDASRAEEKKHQEAIFDLGEEELDESSEDDGDIGTARR